MLSTVSGIRQPLVIALFALQVGWVATHFFDRPAYFTWAPVQALTKYQIRVQIGATTLTGFEACRRYRFRVCSFDHHSPDHVFDAIRQYETTYGASEHAEVKVDYRVNGSEVRTWSLQR